MQAVILAAGRSTRTHPVTDGRPKPLVPVWGRPFLEYQMRQLPRKVEEVLIVVGFLKELIAAHFGESFDGRVLRYVTQERQRGTADALLAARPFISARCLVLNGDDFYHGDDLHGLAETERGLLVTRARDPQNRAVVTVEDDRIVDIVEKPPSPAPDAWCSVGGYCVAPEDLRYLDELSPSIRGELELPDFVLRVVRESRVRPVLMKKLWLPLTYAWDVLAVMNRFWSSETTARELGLDPGGQSTHDVEIEGPIHMGDGVELGRRVRLKGPLALGDGTVVGDDATLENVVTFEDATIGSGAHIESSVIGAGAVIGDGARLVSAPGPSLTVEVKGNSVVPDIENLGAVIGDGVVVPAGRSLPAGTLLATAKT